MSSPRFPAHIPLSDRTTLVIDHDKYAGTIYCVLRKGQCRFSLSLTEALRLSSNAQRLITMASHVQSITMFKHLHLVSGSILEPYTCQVSDISDDDEPESAEQSDSSVDITFKDGNGSGLKEGNEMN